MNVNKRPTVLMILVLAWLVLGSPHAAEAEMRLDASSRDGYRVWLHNLETTAAAREAGGDTEVIPAYPFGLLSGHETTRTDSLGLLAVARQLDELESLPRILQEPARKTALHALTRARNYRQIAEYDTALTWYETAARRDSTGALRHEAGPEAMATAVASGDSLAATRQLLALFGSRDLQARHLELVLAYRHFVASADTANVDLLLAEVGRHVNLAGASGDLVFWHAFALNWRGHWEESLDLLCGLLDADGFTHGLSEDQRTWVLVAIADQLVITGHVAEAAPLYQALADSGLPGASEWAACQDAAIAFLAGRYLEAGTAFEQLCDQRESFPWRAYACSMSELSDEMQRLRNEGQDHGAVAHYER
jgi:hypothetical protein